MRADDVDEPDALQRLKASARAWRERRDYGDFSLPSRIWVAVPWPHDCPVQLLPERWWDRLAKWTRFAREHQTKDALFDAEVYIATDDPVAAATVVDHPDERNAILILLNQGAREIRTGDGELMARFSNRDGLEDDGTPTHPDDAAWLDNVALSLAVIASHKPEGAVELRRSRIAAVLELGVGTLLSFACMAMLAEWWIGSSTIDSPDLSRLQMQVGIAGAALGLLLTLGVAARKMGRANAHRLTFATLVAAVPAGLMIGHSAPPAANTLLDTAPAYVETLPVIDRWWHRPRKSWSRYYYVSVDHPRHGPVTVEVSRQTYDASAIGTCVAVTLHAGALSYERVTQAVPASCPAWEGPTSQDHAEPANLDWQSHWDGPMP